MYVRQEECFCTGEVKVICTYKNGGEIIEVTRAAQQDQVGIYSEFAHFYDGNIKISSGLKIQIS